MLMTPLSLLSLVLLSTSSYAVPLTRRALPTLKVVTNAAGSEDACDATQVATLKAALAEGASLATKAATALSKTGAEGSDGVTKFLGTITAANLGTQITKRLSNPASAFTSTLTSVDAFGTDDAVYFFCPDKNDPDNDPCDATSDAVTENKLTGSTQNTIALCDPFFDGKTLAGDTTAYVAAAAADAKTVKFPSPRSKGVILVHEAQHSLPILQSTTKSDNLQDKASTPEQASKLPSSKQKQGNAENWALLAFLAQVDSGRLELEACDSDSASKRAVGDSKAGAACPVRSNNSTSSSTSASSSTSSSSSAASSSATSVSSSSSAATTSAPVTSKAATSAPATSAAPSVTAKPTTTPAKPPAAPTKPPTAPVKPPTAPVKPPTVPVKPPTVPVKPPVKKPGKGIKLRRL